MKIEISDLINYPWESIFLDGKYIVISVSNSIHGLLIMFIFHLNTSINPLKVLIVYSSPTAYELPVVTVENEIKAIESSLRKEKDYKSINVHKDLYFYILRYNVI